MIDKSQANALFGSSCRPPGGGVADGECSAGAPLLFAIIVAGCGGMSLIQPAAEQLYATPPAAVRAANTAHVQCAGDPYRYQSCIRDKQGGR